MATVDKEEMRAVMKVFSQNLPIISTLYPSNSLNQSQISQKVGWDGGTITKAIKTLLEKRFVYVKQEIPGAGKPQKILSLTDVSVRLYSELIRYFEEDYPQKGASDKVLLDEYFTMLESKDPEVRQQAADGLYNESTRNTYPNEVYLLKLRDKIFDRNNLQQKKVLLQTLVNLAINSNDAGKAAVERIFREPLEKLFNEGEKGTDDLDHYRFLAINVLGTTLNPQDRFDVLKEGYLKLLEEGSGQAIAARTLLIDRCPDRIRDIKLMLLRKYSSSNGELRTRIGDELDQIN
jgi:DNA-binding MarR family transcriptional regulator